MPSRRVFLGSVLSLAACAHRGAGGADAVLARAIIAAGGRAALDAARVLTWQGDAVVHAGDRRIEISVDTTVMPFGFARSETWLTAQGRSSLRTLEIQDSKGATIINGVRRDMTSDMLANERAQYALYGLLRLVPLIGTPLELTALPADAPPHARVALWTRHPEAPPALLLLDSADRMCAIDNLVPNSEAGKPPLRQRMLLDGTIEGGGVRWPRSLSLLQDGTLFFELRLTRFAPRASL